MPGLARFLARTQERDGLLLPGDIRKLQVCEIGNGDTGTFENLSRFGTGQPDCGEFIADVGELDIVGDDVVIEQLQYFFLLSAFRIHQQRVSTLENVEVRLNPALRVQQEGIDAVAGSKIANVVCGHAIEPADAVPAGHRDFGAPVQVVEAAT